MPGNSKDLEKCSEYCDYSLYNNTVCDEVCNTIECLFDNYNCECADGCTAFMVFGNTKCDPDCDYKKCNYDNENCLDSSNSSYINLLTIIGFIIIGISFCLIFGIMVWYIKKRRHESFQRVQSSENSTRNTILELNKKIPELKCPENYLGEPCSICLEDFKEECLIRRLFCNHNFHSECIIQWITEGSSSACPLCNSFVLK